MTDEAPKANGQEPKYNENLPATVKAVGKMMSAPNIAQRITNLLPKEIPLDKYRSVVLHYLRQNPSLHNANPDSLLLACLDCAESGLLPDRVYGQAYIVPFKGQAQFILGYRGMITLAMNSNKIDSIHAAVVMETDEFEVHQGSELKIIHKPDLKVDRSKAVPIAAYAIAFIKGARNPEFVVMTHSEVEAIRKRAHSGNSPAWKDNYAEMMRKTAIRRLFKTLPMSITEKAGKFAAIEDNFEETGRVTHIDGDYTVEEETNAQVDTGDAAPAEGGRGGAGSGGEQAGDQARAEPRKADSRAGAVPGDAGAAAKPRAARPSPRLKQALQESVAQAQDDDPLGRMSMQAMQEQMQHKPVPPHDPETGEIIESKAHEVADTDEGPSFVTADEAPDTGPVDAVIIGAKRAPDLERWVVDVSNKLERFTSVQQVQQFETATHGTRLWTYIKARSPEAQRQFVELVEMRKEALS
jgi:recombination protein RecT